MPVNRSSRSSHRPVSQTNTNTNRHRRTTAREPLLNYSVRRRTHETQSRPSQNAIESLIQNSHPEANTPTTRSSVRRRTREQLRPSDREILNIIQRPQR